VSSAAQLAQGYYGGNEVIDKVQGLAQPTQSSEHPRVGHTHTQQGFSKLNKSQSVGIKHGNGMQWTNPQIIHVVFFFALKAGVSQPAIFDYVIIFTHHLAVYLTFYIIPYYLSLW